MNKYFTPLFLFTAILLNFSNMQADEFQEEIAYVQKLDSIINYSSETGFIVNAQYFIYDAKGNIHEQSYYRSENEVLVGDEKNLMSYDENSNITQEINQEWDYNTNDWRNSNKTEYEYDNMNNNTEKIEYSWFKQTSEWFAQEKMEYKYDDENNLIETIQFDMQGEDWEPLTKVEYKYEDGKLIEENKSELILNEWEVQIQKLYEYDINGNISLFQLYFRLTSELQPLRQDEYYYDENQNLVEMLESRGTASYDWTPAKKIEYFYDSGNLIKELESNYLDNMKEWYPFFKNEMEYDNNGYMTLLQEFQYDREEEVWNSYQKYEYEYDEYGNVLMTIDRADDTQDGTWRFGYKDEIEIDYSVALSEIMINDMIRDMFVHKPVSGKTSFWSVEDQQWNEYYYSELYYSDATTSVLERDDISVLLFPNPARDKIKISGLSEIANLEIYSVSGERLISKRLLPGEEINISGFSAGTYIYNLRVNGGQASGKFIKY